jgi:V/A-type H+-transporting ATPase subunit F
MSEQLALVADHDTVLGFGSLGMDCYIAETNETAFSALKEIGPKKYAVVFLTDEVAGMLGEELKPAMKKMLLMKIPSCRSRKNMGLEEISTIVEKAVGISNIMDKV